MGKPESKVEQHLRKRVEAAGGLCLKFSAQFSGGVPDRIVVVAGRTFFVETKAPLGDLSDLQRARHEEIRSAGGQVEVLFTRVEVDLFLDLLLNPAPQGDDPSR